MGTDRVIVASLKSSVEAITLPEGSINPLIPVLAERIIDLLFSTAQKIVMEKC